MSAKEPQGTILLDDGAGPHQTGDDRTLVRNLAGQFKALNILWATLTVLQVLSCAGIIAAGWNAYVLYRRWKFPQLILERSPALPE
jgi:hypothetical protein